MILKKKKKRVKWVSLTWASICNSLCVLSPGQIPGFCAGSSSIPGKVNCDMIVGYKSVYRMCFAMACFFFLFAIIMIRVRSSKDPRAAIQNGLVRRAAAPVWWKRAALCWPNAWTAPHESVFKLHKRMFVQRVCWVTFFPFFGGPVSGSSSSSCWLASLWELSLFQMARLLQVLRAQIKIRFIFFFFFKSTASYNCISNGHPSILRAALWY